MKKMENFVIIDGHHLLFRMFYGIQSKIRSKDGRLINAVLGFISSTLKYIKSYDPKYFLVIFDSENANFRSEIEEDYKGNRQSDFSGVIDDDNPLLQPFLWIEGKDLLHMMRQWYLIDLKYLPKILLITKLL